MHVNGYSKIWKPRLSLKDPNGVRLKDQVGEDDKIDLTIENITFKKKGELTTKPVDERVVLRVMNVNLNNDVIILDELPSHTKSIISNLDGFSSSEKLVYNVHSILKEDKNSITFDNQKGDTGGKPTTKQRVSNNDTRVYSRCSNCKADISQYSDPVFCPDCGTEI